MRCPRGLAAVGLVALAMALFAGSAAAFYRPSSDYAIALRSPRGFFAGMLLPGAPVVTPGQGNGSLVLYPSGPVRLRGFSAWTACPGAGGGLVAGFREARRVFLVMNGGLVERAYATSLPGAPKGCTYWGDRYAAALSDPLGRNSVVIVGPEGAEAVRLPRRYRVLHAAAPLEGGGFVATGRGFYAVGEPAPGGYRVFLFNVSTPGAIEVDLAGAAPLMGGGFALYGSAKIMERNRTVRIGLLYLPGVGWLEPSIPGENTRVRSVYESLPGVLYVFLEVIGKKTLLLALDREGRVLAAYKIVVLAPYSLVATGAGPGLAWAVGDLYPKGEKSFRVFHIIREPGAYVIGEGPGYALIEMGRASRPGWIKAPIVVKQADSLLLEPRRLDEAKPPLVEPASPDYRIYKTFVDRPLLACALLSVSSLLFAPVAAAVYSYNCPEKRGVGRRA